MVRQWIGFSAGDEKTNCSGLNAKRFVRVRKVILKIKGGTQRKQERRVTMPDFFIREFLPVLSCRVLLRHLRQAPRHIFLMLNMGCVKQASCI